jgi:ATPase family associated with various cellular activities (AAA)
LRDASNSDITLVTTQRAVGRPVARRDNPLAPSTRSGIVDRVSTPNQPPPDIADLRGLARGLRLLFEIGARTLAEDAGPSELALRVTGHLGCDLTAIVAVTERFPKWEHVNIQRGVDAYLAARQDDAEWFGAPGAGLHPHENILSSISAPALFGGIRIAGPRAIRVAAASVSGSGAGGSGAASYGTAAIGPEENTEVVTFGLVAATAPDGAPVVIGVRDESQFGPPFCSLEILAAQRSAAAATRDEIERLMRARDVFRGQVLSFTESEHHGNELVSFLPRPAVTGADVVLPEGVLDSIEQHIIGVADWSQELLRAGQHLKRGLLLHGPPGTGKTHTVRYLTGRLADSTVILLTGRSIRFIDAAAALARRLQPSMVVLEDVDLVATDRDYTPDGNPLLFSLLDAMDGVGADADVTFVLTTNRADILETALADRPGRVDLAIEIPRPDPGCRERLFRVYVRDLAMHADLAPVVAGTEGVTASFVKEMIRRTVLVSLRAGERPPVLRDAHFTEVLAEMNGERHALTRSLLGVDPGGGGPADAELPARPGPPGRPAPTRYRRLR